MQNTECKSIRLFVLKYKNKFGILSIIFGVIVFATQNSVSLMPVDNNVEVIETPIKALEELSLANMLILRKIPTTVCIDIRVKRFYNYAHIPGAVSLPLEKMGPTIPKQILDRLKKSANIIIYSNAYANSELRNAVDKLSMSGFDGIKVYLLGWESWKACELPVEKIK
jgi:rhodanese-related sulfurtransferase